jgi:hypothetical protein
MEYNFMNIYDEIETVRADMSKLSVPRYSGNWREDYKVLLTGEKKVRVIYIGKSEIIKTDNIYKIGISAYAEGREKTARIKILDKWELEETASVESVVHTLLSHRNVLLPEGVDGRSEYFYGTYEELWHAVNLTVTMWKKCVEYKKRSQRRKGVIKMILKSYEEQCSRPVKKEVNASVKDDD